ncbi:hypothetical protein OAB47_05270 [Vicingaceae bacterium]|mgnify:CR=1 FL=1|nr:hypothetical protein [Vicingaceae bacterium]
MENLNLTVKNIKNSVLALVKKQEQTLGQLELERKKVVQLNEEIAQLRLEINELEDRNNVLKLAGNSTEGGNRDMKLKLNELVREVDKCIAQFNK